MKGLFLKSQNLRLSAKNSDFNELNKIQQFVVLLESHVHTQSIIRCYFLCFVVIFVTFIIFIHLFILYLLYFVIKCCVMALFE